MNLSQKSSFALGLMPLIFILFFLSSLKAETPKRVLCLSELVSEMVHAKEDYKLIDAIVRFDPEKDKKFEETPFDSLKKQHIKVQIILKNITFEKGINITFANLVFEEEFNFYDCFGDPYLIFFQYCKFQNGLDFRRNKFNTLGILECEVYNRVVLQYLKIDQIYFENIKFDVNIPKLTRHPDTGELIPPFFYISNSSETSYFLNIDKCVFNYKLPKSLSGKVIMNSSFFSNFTLSNSYFNIPLDLEDATISNKFSVIGNVFEEGIYVGDLQTPEFNSRITWGQISGKKIKVVVDLSDDGSGLYGYNIYDPYSGEGIADNDNYNRLIHAYAKLYQFYKGQGDVISSRSCLVEWKDLETKYFGHLYEKEKGVFNYFKWKMNEFLRVFCDYGTNPIKSMVWSIFVIMGFAFLYFIIPYDLSSTAKNPFSEIFQIVILAYFKSEKNQIETSSWFSRISKKIYNTIFVAIYFIWLTILRLLNAIILSLNMFTSLGFGTVQVKGALLYLAVIEGFTGWFLLSIFSVSLISQVLQ